VGIFHILSVQLFSASAFVPLYGANVVSASVRVAEKETVDNSYVSRMVNLTLLAPDIVAAILNDVLPQGTSLFELAIDVPVSCKQQGKRTGAIRLRNKVEQT